MKKSILFVFLILNFEACKKKAEFIHPQIEDITESVYASGKVSNIKEYLVFATATGTISQINVKEGDRVKKGDILFKITNTTANLNTENAQLSADFAMERANQDKINELRTAINSAKTKLELDASLLQRQQNLWNQNIGTQLELDQRQLAYKNSVSAVETAQLRLSQLQKQITFQAKQSQKNLQIAQKISADYVVKAEISGTVYNLTKEINEMVNPQSPIASIGDDTDFKLELQVDEFDITKIKIGQKMLINMDSYKGQVFDGLVDKIYPIMNDRSKTFKIDGHFVQKPPNLYPNLTCEANIVINQKQKALTIPRNYLLDGDYILGEENKKIKVVAGLKDYQKVEIISGITAEDAIYKPN